MVVGVGQLVEDHPGLLRVHSRNFRASASSTHRAFSGFMSVFAEPAGVGVVGHAGVCGSSSSTQIRTARSFFTASAGTLWSVMSSSWLPSHFKVFAASLGLSFWNDLLTRTVQPSISRV